MSSSGRGQGIRRTNRVAPGTFFRENSSSNSSSSRTVSNRVQEIIDADDDDDVADVASDDIYHSDDESEYWNFMRRSNPPGSTIRGSTPGSFRSGIPVQGRANSGSPTPGTPNPRNPRPGNSNAQNANRGGSGICYRDDQPGNKQANHRHVYNQIRVSRRRSRDPGPQTHIHDVTLRYAPYEPSPLRPTSSRQPRGCAPPPVGVTATTISTSTSISTLMLTPT